MASFLELFSDISVLKIEKNLNTETNDLPAEIMHREIIDVESCGDK
jgi:hypothetical protein